MKTSNAMPVRVANSMRTISVNGKTYHCPYRDLLPPLDPAERAALKKGIEKDGIRTPIILDEYRNVIDGANRVEVALELGVTEIPEIVYTGLSEEEKRRMAEDLNLKRRHLTSEQKRQIVARRLKADPFKSDRQIAEDVGVDHKTVGSERNRLVSTGEIPQSKTSRGSDGRTRKRTRRSTSALKTAAGTTTKPGENATNQSKRQPTKPSEKLASRSDTWHRLQIHGESLVRIGQQIIELAGYGPTRCLDDELPVAIEELRAELKSLEKDFSTIRS